jgi:DNA-binding transcriptional MocR family regulator
VLGRGYRNVSQLRIDQDGVWRGTAELNGIQLAANALAARMMRTSEPPHQRQLPSLPAARVLPNGKKLGPARRKAAVTFRGERPALPEAGSRRMKIDFWPGRPNPNLFPMSLVRKLTRIERTSTTGRELTDYGDAFGMRELRKAIALHLETVRGLATTYEQIIITSGIQLLEELASAFGELDLWASKAACISCGGCRAISPSEFIERVARHGVRIHSLHSGGAHDMGSQYAKDAILFGYSSLSREEIKKAVRVMRNAVDDCVALRSPRILIAGLEPAIHLLAKKDGPAGQARG